MSKHRLQHKAQQSNRGDTSISVGPENQDQISGQSGPFQSSLEDGFVPAYEDVQRRAYKIHEEKGGSDLENWLEAERVLREEIHGQER